MNDKIEEIKNTLARAESQFREAQDILRQLRSEGKDDATLRKELVKLGMAGVNLDKFLEAKTDVEMVLCFMPGIRPDLSWK